MMIHSGGMDVMSASQPASSDVTNVTAKVLVRRMAKLETT